MASIFSRIIAGELPGRFVWDDDLCVAMVDIRPLRKGHCLVIPKEEVDQWVDLDATTGNHLMTVARNVGLAQRAVFPCERIGLLIAGYEVPHTHVHVFPSETMNDFDFRNADPSANAADLDAVAELLRATLVADGHAESVPTPVGD